MKAVLLSETMKMKMRYIRAISVYLVLLYLSCIVHNTLFLGISIFVSSSIIIIDDAQNSIKDNPIKNIIFCVLAKYVIMVGVFITFALLTLSLEPVIGDYTNGHFPLNFVDAIFLFCIGGVIFHSALIYLSIIYDSVKSKLIMVGITIAVFIGYSLFMVGKIKENLPEIIENIFDRMSNIIFTQTNNAYFYLNIIFITSIIFLGFLTLSSVTIVRSIDSQFQNDSTQENTNDNVKQ